jgi:hypothetical protein
VVGCVFGHLSARERGEGETIREGKKSSRKERRKEGREECILRCSRGRLNVNVNVHVTVKVKVNQCQVNKPICMHPFTTYRIPFQLTS